MKNVLLTLIIIFANHICKAQSISKADRPYTIKLKIDKNALWWVGVIDHGYLMPLKENYHAETTLNNFNNQIQPLLLSNGGEVIWCDNPLNITFNKDSLIVGSTYSEVLYKKAGNNLKQAYQYAVKNYFPPTKKMPDKALFASPQYNTWIELMYNQNQKDILRYASAIIEHKMPPGVLMIDDNWQEDYGNLKFHAERFHNPISMVDSLHKMGFKVMLWVSPFVSPDSYIFRQLSEKKYLLTDSTGQPAMVRWWNGVSSLLDFTNPEAVTWFKTQLNNLMKDYKIDGFKFDAGDFNFYKDVLSLKNITPAMHSEIYGQIGESYALNEFRAIFKMGGHPIANRLADKNHTWADLQKLVPNMILENLMGYQFSCPDMIGGGEFKSFLRSTTIDQKLIVRSAQCHALMPMMQFSVAPWRVLDDEHFKAVMEAIALRKKFNNYILKTVEESALSGEPVLYPLEYFYPHQGFEFVKDQFMIGDSLMVAPILEKNVNKRKIKIPIGTWKSFSGSIYNGPKDIEIWVNLSTIPYFIKIN